MSKPFSAACENNKRPILQRLSLHLRDVSRVLEIGSGTGQHAVFFGERLPQLVWQTSDLAVHHDGIRAWLADAQLPNVKPPLTLDVTAVPWPVTETDAIFSANTAHIMPWGAVEAMIAGAGRVLRDGGLFLLYGPFNYDGCHTSESNARFDDYLRVVNPAQGIRDFETVDERAAQAGLSLTEDHPMPANNRLLVWRRHRGVRRPNGSPAVST